MIQILCINRRSAASLTEIRNKQRRVNCICVEPEMKKAVSGKVDTALKGLLERPLRAEVDTPAPRG